MITLLRERDIPDPSQPTDKILKRRILNYKQTFTIPKEEEVKNVIEAKKKIDSELEVYEALQDFSRFEQRSNAKSSFSSTLPKPIIDKNVINKFNTIEGPLFDPEIKNFSQSQPISPRHSIRCHSNLASPRNSSRFCEACNPPPQEKGKKLLAPPWNIVDEPLRLLPRKINGPRSNLHGHQPWLTKFDKDNPDGIPIFSKEEQQYHQKKIDKYQQDVRYQLTIDRKKKEDAVKKNAQKSLENVKITREKTDQLYIKSGQKWCLDEIQRRKHLNDKPEKPKTLDAIDLEAIRALDKKTREEAEEERYRKQHPNIIDI